MFDPHRTRRSDRRYYTRKGQVLQASRVNVNPTIDQRLVPIYKNYIIKNNLLTAPSPPPSMPIHPIGIAVIFETGETNYYPFTGMTLITEPSYNIQVVPLSTARALLLFQQKTDGSFVFLSFTFSAAFNYNVTDNVKCYYTIISVTNPDTFLDANKSLYHTSGSPENIFLTVDRDKTTQFNTNQELFISSQLNIVL